VTIKFTMLLQANTAISSPTAPVHRIAGWSESWYYPGTSLQSCLAAAFGGVTGLLSSSLGLVPARAGLLPLGCSVVGERVQVVDPPGLSQSLASVYPGNPAFFEGYPSIALLAKIPGVGVRNIRRVLLRALPSAVVVEGEYTPNVLFAAQLALFTQALAGWQFRGRDLAQPLFHVLTISAAGAVQCQENVPFTVGQAVRVLRSRDVTGDLRGGRFVVSTTGPLSSQFTIPGWPFGACTGGTVRADAVVYPAVDTSNPLTGRAVTKKVGRPFFQFRGRRAKST
jgi:hypothetical protein